MVESEGAHHIRSIRVVAALQIVYLIVGIPWNTAVIFVLLNKKYYKDPTYAILLNMVIADLVICALCLPFGIAFVLSLKFTVGNTDYSRCCACITITITTIIFTDYSLFTLALLSIDRLIYIRWPLKYENIMTLKNVFIILVVSALVCTISAIPPAFGFGEIKFANPLGLCALYIVGTNLVTKNVYYILMGPDIDPELSSFGEIKFANPLGLCALYIVGTNLVTKNVYYILMGPDIDPELSSFISSHGQHLDDRYCLHNY